MATTNETTTLVCLFHHRDHAEAALHDLRNAGLADTAITVIDGSVNSAPLADLPVPDRDLKHLAEGLRAGGVIIAVSPQASQAAAVEKVFGAHQATQIDEAVAEPEQASADLPLAAAAAGGQVIPIVDEELAVGKRTVDQGGVRVYRRVVEVPVEESVNLREEHVSVDRHPVDRAVTDADRAFSDARTIELTETAEEAVIGKSARVVEEVSIGKVASERTEHIHDTVRRTEVEVEEIAPANDRSTSGSQRQR